MYPSCGIQLGQREFALSDQLVFHRVPLPSRAVERSCRLEYQDLCSLAQGTLRVAPFDTSASLASRVVVPFCLKWNHEVDDSFVDGLNLLSILRVHAAELFVY